MKYLAYEGSWLTGRRTYLDISTGYTYPNSSGYSERYATSDELFDVYPWAEPSNTIFITKGNESYIDEYEQLGCTDVRLLTQGVETRYYISETKYLSIDENGSSTLIRFYDGDEYVLSRTGGYIETLPSVISNLQSGKPTIWYVRTINEQYELQWSVWGTSTQIQLWLEYWNDAQEYDEDPYSSGGNSGTGGGTGTFSGIGDSVDFPSLPTLSAVSTGFITLFNPSIAEMQNLATYMWSDVFDIGLYKTLFADPMDCILGCSIVPVAVPNGGTKTVNVGNVSTGISMTVAASQYVEVDCGTLNVDEYWGSYLDYDPYTKAEIYLPYCGTHALQVDDIMGKAVHVKYHVDILSGACCAYVKCGSSVMYSFVGQCSSSIPISANDWTNVVNGALTIAASVGSLIATGGASAPMAVGAAAAVTGTIYGGGIKQNVEKSGSMGGTGGMLAVQTPYLILTRPRQALPKKQNTYTGYPSFITTKLEDLKGYTEIDSIRITGVPATDAELTELESILKSGVIF